MNTLRLAALLAAAPFALAANSAPDWTPLPDTIPAPRDVAYPGTMTLKVDATDLERRIFRVEQRIPVTGPGPLVLLSPKWLPGNHAPRGQIEKVAGLVIKANGKTLTWRRDPVDVYAFHIDVPAGADAVDVSFQFISATEADQGRIVITQEMMNIQWEAVSLYPAGHFTRRVPVQATVTYPRGWQAGTALRGTKTGDTVRYDIVSYDVLQDSPVFAGKYFRRDDLGQGVTLNTVADEAKELTVTPEVLQYHRNLVTQAVKLFGARHFDHYDFLHAITDRMGGIGLEHHRSSENQNDPGYFLDWKASLPDHNLLPHEFTHSWNGKFRQGADSWTPDFRVPKGNSLLWVYEGQTQFWGFVLEARSGLSAKQEVLDKLAAVAANLDVRRGRDWRSLDDTTNDPVISARRPKGWTSYQRSEDYYAEGMLIWLEADAIIRAGTKGQRGMDDFARAFFGINDGDWGVVTYTFDDLVRTLNGVYAYDWNAFLRQRLTEKADRAPLGGFTRGGYRLTYTDTPTDAARAAAKQGKTAEFAYSLGLTLNKDAKISAVVWGSPAYDAGLTVGETVIAAGGTAYSEDALKTAITAAKGGNAPVRLTVKSGTAIREVPIKWNGGLRYPRFEKTGRGEGSLDKLLAPRP